MIDRIKITIKQPVLPEQEARIESRRSFGDGFSHCWASSESSDGRLFRQYHFANIGIAGNRNHICHLRYSFLPVLLLNVDIRLS